MRTAGDPGRSLRQAVGCFPSGAVALAATSGGVPSGFFLNSFTSVSLAPPLVSVCVQHTSRTWPELRPRRRLGLSVLAAGDIGSARQLSSRDGDRFRGIGWEATVEGSVFISSATAFLDCRVYEELEAGDHVLVLLEVLGCSADPTRPPLVFHASQFRALAAHTTERV
ncbi:flavin reductase family protein [Amycolatopsis ultiminotia]